MRFPTNWPPDCPPSDAVAAQGTVYRIVRQNPPTADDFASHSETGRLKNAPPCLRCGLSVFRGFEDAVHQRLLLPKLGSFIAKAPLKAEHGKTKLTKGSQPSHTTWWPFDDVERAALFSVVLEDKQ